MGYKGNEFAPRKKVLTTGPELDAYFIERFESLKSLTECLCAELKATHPGMPDFFVKEEIKKRLDKTDLERLRQEIVAASGKKLPDGSTYSAKPLASHYSDMMRDYFPWYF